MNIQQKLEIESQIKEIIEKQQQNHMIINSTLASIEYKINSIEGRVRSIMNYLDSDGLWVLENNQKKENIVYTKISNFFKNIFSKEESVEDEWY